MKTKNAFLIFLVFIVAAIGFAVWDLHVAVEGLSRVQREQMKVLRMDLNRVRPGDMITINYPRKVRFETYMVKQLDPPNAAWLSGPGPESRQEKGRYLNWRSNSRVRYLMENGICVHHRDNDDQEWKQLAAWYYLQ